MKIVQVIPRADADVGLKAELKATERRLRGGRTTFARVSEGKLKHVNYAGRITFEETRGGILVAEVKAEDSEWQLLLGFVG
jgi:hypothetical protein